MRTRLAAVLIAAFAVACESAPRPADEEITVWRPVGSWSGRSVMQTDAFISDTGQLRVTWKATPLTPAAEAAGTFRIFLHSAVSGRLLATAVEQRGAGQDAAYITEDPRSFYLVIESSQVEWDVQVAEGVPAIRRASTR